MVSMTRSFAPVHAGVDEPKLRILFMGRLDPYKGLFDLLKSMKILRERALSRPGQVHLHIVGEGDLREALQKGDRSAGADGCG